MSGTRREYLPQSRRCRLLSVSLQATGFANYVLQLRQVVMFLRRRERDRGVEACDADDGAVEIVEHLFIYDGGDFASQASGAGVFVQDDDLVRLLHRLYDGFAVERRDGAQVE